MAHLGDVAADRIEHLEGRHDLARGVDRDVADARRTCDLMRSATRSADMPGPGNRFGHDVTMRQRLVWAQRQRGSGERRRRHRLRRFEQAFVA